MYLSCEVRLSMNLITVLDIPSVFAISRIFLWAPFRVNLCSCKFVSILEPDPNRLSISLLTSFNFVLCCNAASIITDVSASFLSNLRVRRASLSRSSWSLWYLQYLYKKTFTLNILTNRYEKTLGKLKNLLPVDSLISNGYMLGLT